MLYLTLLIILILKLFIMLTTEVHVQKDERRCLYMLSKNEVKTLGIVAGVATSIATKSIVPLLVVAGLALLFWSD
jgi:energy-converting hydrogenase Eha subunit G